MTKIFYQRYNSIPKMLESTVKRVPQKIALKYFDSNNLIQSISFAEYFHRAKIISAALLDLKIQPKEHIGLFSETRYEWVICDLGILSINCVTIALFHTLEFEQARFILNDSDCVAIFVSNAKLLERVLKVWDYLPNLRFIFSMEPLDSKLAEKLPVKALSHIFTLADLYKRGQEYEKSHPNVVQNLIDQIQENDLAGLIYTSGTTGIPKGVMLTHKNFISDVIMGAIAIRPTEKEVMVTYLPLAHSFCRTVEEMGCCLTGATLCFAKNYNSLAENLSDFQPNAMIGVPVVFEQIYHRIIENVEKMAPNIRKIFWKAIDLGKRITELEQARKPVPLGMRLKHAIDLKIIFSSLRKKLGGKLNRFLSGGAPLNPDINKFFSAAGVTILEGYGLSESGPVTHTNRPNTTTKVRPAAKIGTVGPLIGWDCDGTKNPYEALEHKISPEGEVLVRGPNIMQGYWKRPEETEAALDKDHWLHTGDLGTIDEDGYLKIIGRAKELLILRTGKKVAPNLVEPIYQENPFIGQIILIGDGQKFISALIVPNFTRMEAILTELKLNPLLPKNQFCHHPKVLSFFQEQLKKMESGRLSTYETVKKFVLIEEPFSEENGLLTPTMKFKRNKIIDRYFSEIQELYKSLTENDE